MRALAAVGAFLLVWQSYRDAGVYDFGMATICVLYPKTAESTFDLDYYLKTHTPLVKSTWTPVGLTDVTLLLGKSALDGGVPAYELIGLLTFKDAEAVQAALACGAEVVGDIANFTNVSPVIQVSESVG